MVGMRGSFVVEKRVEEKERDGGFGEERESMIFLWGWEMEGDEMNIIDHLILLFCFAGEKEE